MRVYPYGFVRPTRRPDRLPPPGAIDSQVHVYDDPQRYPYDPGRTYDPPVDATVAELLAMHRALGIARGVIVQPTAYGTDHRLLLDALAAAPGYRGTAIVDDTLTDAELARLHAAGVRGARFNFKRALGAIPEPAAFERAIARIAEFGWHAKIRSTGAELPDYLPLLRRVRIPVLLDHMGHLDLAAGVDQPACRLILDLLRNDGWWIMLSNADKAIPVPWDAAVPVAHAFIAAAPGRVLWATDWPHLGFTDRPVSNDADLLGLLYRFAPEPATLTEILVDNPARLYGG